MHTQYKILCEFHLPNPIHVEPHVFGCTGTTGTYPGPVVGPAVGKGTVIGWLVTGASVTASSSVKY